MPSGFMSNSPVMLGHLNRRCFGKGGICTRPRGGVHAECMGKRAQRAAIFQEELCVTILRGLRDQLIQDGKMLNNEIGIMVGESAVEDADATVSCSGLRPLQRRATRCSRLAGAVTGSWTT